MSSRVTALDGIVVPSRGQNPADFVTNGDRLLGTLPALQDQMNALADEVNDNAAQAESDRIQTGLDRVAADASATAASATANAAKWVSDTVYAQGVNVWSPTDFQTYRRKVAGAGAVDPVTDTANWQLISGAQLKAKLDMTAITLITYFTNNYINTITYVTGHKVVCIYTGSKLTSTRYYNTDGVTLLYTETFNYTGSHITSTTWA